MGDVSRAETLTRTSALVRYIEDRCSDPGTVYFRGQSSDWPLKPRIMRIRPKRPWGIPNPRRDAERAMLQAFKRRSLPFLEASPKTAWDWLSVAQHHGLPTRFLDWSLNALAALWFAVSEPPVPDRSGKIRPGALYVFRAKREHLDAKGAGGDTIDLLKTRFTPFNVPRPAVFVPRHVSRRIIAQGGYFTVHPIAEDPADFVPLDEDGRYRDRLVKFVIPPEAFPSIRHDLNRLGINRVSIYPDLEGLCANIAWRFAYAADERPEELWDEQGVMKRPDGST